MAFKVQEIPFSEFKTMDSDQQIESFTSSICAACDQMFKRYCVEDKIKVKWWTPELTLKRRLVRRLRNKFQRARSRNDDDTELHRTRLRQAERDYKQDRPSEERRVATVCN